MPQHSNQRSPRRRRQKKKDHEKILEEIKVENFPKMGKEINTKVQESQRVPNRINPRQNTPRNILIKLTKIKHKEQILKAAREKQQIAHKGIPIRITADLSIETLQTRKEWQDILKLMKENNLPILKEINPEYSLEGLMLKLKLQYSGHLMQRADSLGKTLILGKIEGRQIRE